MRLTFRGPRRQRVHVAGAGVEIAPGEPTASLAQHALGGVDTDDPRPRVERGLGQLGEAEALGRVARARVGPCHPLVDGRQQPPAVASRVTLDGVELDVSWGGRGRRYAFAEVDGMAWIARDGDGWAVREEEALAATRTSGSRTGPVVAPMPGTVTAVHVDDGETVTAGQTLDAWLVGGAGGPDHYPGDYAYRDSRQPWTAAGLWGILRVQVTGSGGIMLLP